MLLTQLLWLSSGEGSFGFLYCSKHNFRARKYHTCLPWGVRSLCLPVRGCSKLIWTAIHIVSTPSQGPFHPWGSFSAWSPRWGCCQKKGTVWTAMVSVENQTSNISEHATRIRWKSLKTTSRQKEQNGSGCLGQGGKEVPNRGTHPDPQFVLSEHIFTYTLWLPLSFAMSQSYLPHNSVTEQRGFSGQLLLVHARGHSHSSFLEKCPQPTGLGHCQELSCPMFSMNEVVRRISCSQLGKMWPRHILSDRHISRTGWRPWWPRATGTGRPSVSSELVRSGLLHTAGLKK